MYHMYFKRMCSEVIECGVIQILISPRRLVVVLRSPVFYISYSSIVVERQSLKSLLILKLSVSPLNSDKLCFWILKLCCYGYTNLQLLCFPFIIMKCSSLSLVILFVLKSLSSDLKVVTSAFLCLLTIYIVQQVLE